MKRIAIMPHHLHAHVRTALYDEMAALLAGGPVSVSYDELAFESDRVAAVAVRQAMRKRGLNVHVYRQKTIIAVEKKKPATK